MWGTRESILGAKTPGAVVRPGEAVKKSAAGAASLETRKIKIICEKIVKKLRKNCFFGPKGAFRRPNAGFWRPQAPETSIYKISDLLPKSQKIQNGSVDHPSPVFVTAKPFFAIFGPARGQIYGKTAKK